MPRAEAVLDRDVSGAKITTPLEAVSAEKRDVFAEGPFSLQAQARVLKGRGAIAHPEVPLTREDLQSLPDRPEEAYEDIQQRRMTIQGEQWAHLDIEGARLQVDESHPDADKVARKEKAQQEWDEGLAHWTNVSARYVRQLYTQQEDGGEDARLLSDVFGSWRVNLLVLETEAPPKEKVAQLQRDFEDFNMQYGGALKEDGIEALANALVRGLVTRHTEAVDVTGVDLSNLTNIPSPKIDFAAVLSDFRRVRELLHPFMVRQLLGTEVLEQYFALCVNAQITREAHEFKNREVADLGQLSGFEDALFSFAQAIFPADVASSSISTFADSQKDEQGQEETERIEEVDLAREGRVPPPALRVGIGNLIEAVTEARLDEAAAAARPEALPEEDRIVLRRYLDGRQRLLFAVDLMEAQGHVLSAAQLDELCIYFGIPKNLRQIFINRLIDIVFDGVHLRQTASKEMSAEVDMILKRVLFSEEPSKRWIDRDTHRAEDPWNLFRAAAGQLITGQVGYAFTKLGINLNEFITPQVDKQGRWGLTDIQRLLDVFHVMYMTNEQMKQYIPIKQFPIILDKLGYMPTIVDQLTYLSDIFALSSLAKHAQEVGYTVDPARVDQVDGVDITTLSTTPHQATPVPKSRRNKGGRGNSGMGQGSSGRPPADVLDEVNEPLPDVKGRRNGGGGRGSRGNRGGLGTSRVLPDDKQYRADTPTTAVDPEAWLR